MSQLSCNETFIVWFLPPVHGLRFGQLHTLIGLGREEQRMARWFKFHEQGVNSNSFCSSKLFSHQLLPCLRFDTFVVQKWTEEGIFAVHIDFDFFKYRKFETLSYFNFVFPVMRSLLYSVSYASTVELLWIFWSIYSSTI